MWIEASAENAPRVMAALKAFGAPFQGLAESDLAKGGTGFMMGLPPRRIDILTEISGVEFAEAWPNRKEADVGLDLRCPFIGIDDLIRNKKAAGRPQDLADVDALERIRQRS